MNQQIVNLRAFAILIVMLGHSIIIYDNSFDLLQSDVQMPMFGVLKHWISFVQMKLFISISGFLLAYKCLNKRHSGGGIQFLKDKALRLLVPYVCVLVFYNNPIKYFLEIPGYENPLCFLRDQLLGINCAHLWYLPCLFLLMIICYPLFKWIGKSLWKHILLFLIFLCVNYFSGRFPKYYQLNEVGYYLVFFHLGYLVNYVRMEYPEKLKVLKRWYVYLILTICAITVGYIANRVTSIGFEVYLSVCVMLLFYLLMPSFNNKIINEISQQSYGLYLFHSPLIYFTAIFCPNINPWLMLLINFIGFGCIAYLLTIALRRNRLKFVIGF